MYSIVAEIRGHPEGTCGPDRSRYGSSFPRCEERRMSYEESYAKAFPFDKMVSGMLDPEMIEDTAKIVNEAMKEKVQVNLIISNRAAGKVPLIA
jgi:hypothetical protein